MLDCFFKGSIIPALPKWKTQPSGNGKTDGKEGQSSMIHTLFLHFHFPPMETCCCRAKL